MAIYSNIVLIGCFCLVVCCKSLTLLTKNHVLSSVGSLIQTTPLYLPLCVGDKLVLTCVTTGTGNTYWRYSSYPASRLSNYGSTSTGNGAVLLNVTNITGTTITSTGTIESITALMNGTMISCSSTLTNNYDTFIITVTDPPTSVSNITINPTNNTSAKISWVYNQNGHCIANYNIMTLSNNTSTNTSSATKTTSITGFIIGTTYSFNIIPIDTAGREGPPSSLIQYIWNAPVQVVNVSWHQLSTDSITVWWNESAVLHPPTEYYIISVYVTSVCINSCIVYGYNVSDTNITITGLSLIDKYYTVTIIPVNIIGYGPSININVSILTITSSIMATSTITTTESIMCTLDDKTSLLSPVSVVSMITLIQTITTTELCSSGTESRNYVSCSSITTVNMPSTDGGSISVAIAVPITGLLASLITALITTIIVCLIMRRTKQTKKINGGGAVAGPIYDLPVINNEQQEQIIDTKLNTAYRQTNPPL